jgi:D-glycero-D-manno-heptose 1,7-bisphosphate phosphatase
MKLIVLDRDGVINEDSDAYIKSPDEWHAIPGSLEAIARLNGAGYRVVVATNQSGLARGYFDLATLERIHDKMQAALAAVGGRIDRIFHCPHGPDDFCDCRKPQPGLFRQVALAYGVDLRGVLAVGDSFRDLEAARSAGARPVLVKTGKGERTLAKRGDELDGTPIYSDLAAVVADLLSGKL